MGNEHHKKRRKVSATLPKNALSTVRPSVNDDVSAIDPEASQAPVAVHEDAARAAPAAPAATQLAPSNDLVEGRCEEPGGLGDYPKRRKRLEKTLKQIAELKLRRARGATLDRSMEDKVGRESTIVAELAHGVRQEPTPALSSEDFVCVHEVLSREEERAARAGAVHQSMSFAVDAGKVSAKTADADGPGPVRGAKQRKLDRQRELAWRRDEADEDYDT